MTTIRRISLGLTAPLLCIAVAGHAQTASDSGEARVGSRVRIMAPTVRRDRFIGRIDSLSDQRVVLDTTGDRRRFGFETGPVLVDSYRRTSLERTAVERLEVSGGRTTRGSTLRGLMWGALAGTLIYGVGNLPQVNAGFDDFAKYAPVGAVAGGIIGGIVGYSLGGERWLPARFVRR